MTPSEKQAAIVQVRRERGLGLKAGHDFINTHGTGWREAADCEFGTLQPSHKSANTEFRLKMTEEEKQDALVEIQNAYNVTQETAQGLLDLYGLDWRKGNEAHGSPQPTVPMPPSDGERLEAVREAVREYHQALYNLHPNAVAATAAMSRIQDLLGMPWNKRRRELKAYPYTVEATGRVAALALLRKTAAGYGGPKSAMWVDFWNALNGPDGGHLMLRVVSDTPRTSETSLIDIRTNKVVDPAKLNSKGSSDDV